jgi:flagellar basal-body rod protein FlgB
LPDATISALHAALNGLSERQRVISDNIANLETPQFLAGRVEFEASLARALQDGADPLAATETTRSRSLAATNPNGNNVGLDTETLDGIDTNLRFQLTTTAINDKFRLLRTAIGG